jgi:hypothetical protein
MDDGVPTDWLVTQLDLVTIEQQHTRDDPERANLQPESKLPFGFMNPEWVRLKQKMERGDQLWEFSSPADYWANLAGSGGIALVRNGKVIDTLTLIMN